MTGRFGQLVFGGDAVGVPGGEALAVEGTPDALFAHVRVDDAGRYRPLSGAKTLPTGWNARLGPGLDRDSAIEAIYPLALVHQRQLADGTLRVVSLDEVLIRQSGRYESSAGLSPGGRVRARRTVCGECVRQPVWAGETCEPDGIPCPEPCSILVAFCREAALWEAEPPEGRAPDPAIAWAAFEEPGNELRERYIEEMSTTHA